MKYIFCIFFSALLAFSADFITKKEYAKMLYSNPRGIGCDKCHGKDGEGKVISKYKTVDKKTKQLIEKELKTPKINNLSFNDFKKALDNPKNIMPSYFLTDSELKILYEYMKDLTSNKKGQK